MSWRPAGELAAVWPKPRDRLPEDQSPSRYLRGEGWLPSTDEREWTNPEPAARVCPQSPDEQIPPRHAARRWHTVRAQRPADALRAENARTFRGTHPPGAALHAKRIARTVDSARAVALQFDWRVYRRLASLWYLYLASNKFAAMDRRPAYLQSGCRRNGWSPARCRQAVHELLR